MSAVLTVLVTLIANVASALGTPAAIMSVINTLEQWLPTIIKEVQDVAPLIQNIIDALRNNSAITPDQLAALDALEAKADAEFEAAVAQPDAGGMPQ